MPLTVASPLTPLIHDSNQTPIPRTPDVAQFFPRPRPTPTTEDPATTVSETLIRSTVVVTFVPPVPTVLLPSPSQPKLNAALIGGSVAAGFIGLFLIAGIIACCIKFKGRWASLFAWGEGAGFVVMRRVRRVRTMRPNGRAAGGAEDQPAPYQVSRRDVSFSFAVAHRRPRSMVLSVLPFTLARCPH